MSKTCVNFGVMGAGGIAFRRTIPGMLKAKNCRLAAVMDPVDIQRVASAFKVAKAYTREEDLLADPGQRPLSTLSEDIEWLLVGSGWVTPTQPIKVKGSRYTLKFDAGSVAEDVLVTIHERDPQIADVEFGPDGRLRPKAP